MYTWHVYWWHVSETNAGVRNTGRRSTYVIPGVTRFGMFQKLTPTYVIPGVSRPQDKSVAYLVNSDKARIL